MNFKLQFKTAILKKKMNKDKRDQLSVLKIREILCLIKN